MADAGKNWWEQDLEWSLGGSTTPGLAEGLRTLPAALACYGGGKPGTQPVVHQDAIETVVNPLMAPPPKPPAPPARVAAVASPTVAAASPPPPPPPPPVAAVQEDEYPFTLEQMLDPNFCGYVRKDAKGN